MLIQFFNYHYYHKLIINNYDYNNTIKYFNSCFIKVIKVFTMLIIIIMMRHLIDLVEVAKLLFHQYF